MKRFLILICLLLAVSLFSKAQIYGTTDDGRRVKLNEDGTWQILKTREEANEDDTTSVVKSTFNKPTSATKQRLSGIIKSGIYYDPQKWEIDPNPSSEAAEFGFKHLKGDGYAMVITERIPIPLKGLKNIVLENARGIAKDARITEQEYLLVNGIKILHLVIKGSYSGIGFVYDGYYYSDKDGTIQLITYTGETLYNEYKKDFHDLLNGLFKR